MSPPTNPVRFTPQEQVSHNFNGESETLIGAGIERVAGSHSPLTRTSHIARNGVHSVTCRNRHCPKCHRDQTDRWLTAQRARLLPCAYYLLTFTLPEQLRPLARSHQKTVYGLLMKSAAAALLTLARDPRYVGGRLGCL